MIYEMKSLMILSTHSFHNDIDSLSDEAIAGFI
jgi:hypothetical protein